MRMTINNRQRGPYLSLAVATSHDPSRIPWFNSSARQQPALATTSALALSWHKHNHRSFTSTTARPTTASDSRLSTAARQLPKKLATKTLGKPNYNPSIINLKWFTTRKKTTPMTSRWWMIRILTASYLHTNPCQPRKAKQTWTIKLTKPMQQNKIHHSVVPSKRRFSCWSRHPEHLLACQHWRHQLVDRSLCSA